MTEGDRCSAADENSIYSHPDFLVLLLLHSDGALISRGGFNFPHITLLEPRVGEDRLRVHTKQTLMPPTMSNAWLS